MLVVGALAVIQRPLFLYDGSISEIPDGVLDNWTGVAGFGEALRRYGVDSDGVLLQWRETNGRRKNQRTKRAEYMRLRRKQGAPAPVVEKPAKPKRTIANPSKGQQLVGAWQKYQPGVPASRIVKALGGLTQPVEVLTECIAIALTWNSGRAYAPEWFARDVAFWLDVQSKDAWGREAAYDSYSQRSR